MKTKIQLLIYLLPILFGKMAYSQNATYEWINGLCECDGEFDSNRYSREQIENTQKYLMRVDYIHADATSWTLEGVKDLSFEMLAKECLTRLYELEKSDFIENPY